MRSMLIVTIVAGAMAAFGIGLFVYALLGGWSFQEQVQTNSKQRLEQINRLSETDVVVPPRLPDGKPQPHMMAVNEPTIRALTSIQQAMTREKEAVHTTARQVNRGRRQLIVEGLFLNPDDQALPFTAKQRYRDRFEAMLRSAPDPKYPTLPFLDAGGPAQQEAIVKHLTAAQAAFLRATAGAFRRPDPNNLPANQQAALRDALQKSLLEYLQGQARHIHVYAQLDRTQPDYPFQVDAWAMPGEGRKPTMTEMWVGQMGQWIQRDIVEAIARTNQVTDPKSDVMVAPIKRLLKIRVYPGAVGTETLGGIVATETAADATGRTAFAQPASGTALPVAVGITPVLSVPTAAGANAKLPDDFTFGPTGRKSNHVYDVWHARVLVVLDAQRMHEFFENLAAVNFMTVLAVKVQGVDDYDAMQEGFLYGFGDSVLADILIETIWFREWTTAKGMMPVEVKEKLGIVAPGTTATLGSPPTPAPGPALMPPARPQRP